MTSDDLIAAFKTIWDGVWHQPDITASTIADSFTDDYQFHISSLENPIDKPTFSQFVPGWQKAFPDGRMEILDITAEGNKVWCYWKSTGTHSEEYLGIWRFNEDGRVAESWAVPDVLSLLRQLGAIPS